jgi:hypothetical protein
VFSKLSQVVTGIRDVLDLKVTADAQKHVEAAVEFLKTAVPLIITGLQYVANQMGGEAVMSAKAMTDAVSVVFQNLSTMIGAMKELMELTIGNAGPKIDALLNAVSIVFDRLRNWTLDLSDLPLLEMVLEEIAALFTNLETMAGILSTGLDLTVVYEAGKSIGELWVTGIVDGIKAQMVNLTGALQQVIGSMLQHGGGAGTLPTTAGAYTPAYAAYAGAGGGGSNSNYTINVYNPTGNPTEESVMRTLKNLASVGVLSPIGG